MPRLTILIDTGEPVNPADPATGAAPDRSEAALTEADILEAALIAAVRGVLGPQAAVRVVPAPGGIPSGTHVGPDFVHFIDGGAYRRTVPRNRIHSIGDHGDPVDGPLTIVMLDDADRILVEEPYEAVLEQLRATARSCP